MRIICLLAAIVCSFSALATAARATEARPRQSVHNDNFIVTGPTLEMAETVLARAELLRDKLSSEWLGAALPPSVGRTIIHIKITKEQDAAWTWPASGPRDPSHMMWIQASTNNAAGSLLAHELTHVVLLTEYPGKFPAWANEGIASLQDDADRKAIRQRILAWYAKTQNWPSVPSVLRAEKISPSDQAAYAVSSALVEFLLTQGSRAQLIDFAVAGKGGDWETALERFYGIKDYRSLERKWQAWIRQSMTREQLVTAEP